MAGKTDSTAGSVLRPPMTASTTAAVISVPPTNADRGVPSRIVRAMTPATCEHTHSTPMRCTEVV